MILTIFAALEFAAIVFLVRRAVVVEKTLQSATELINQCGEQVLESIVYELRLQKVIELLKSQIEELKK